MRITHVERAVCRWFAEEMKLPKGFRDAIHLHRPGEAFSDRHEFFVFPRIESYTPAVTVRPLRGEQHGQLALIVGCHVKNPAGGREDLEELAKLEDTVRAVIDASQRAGAAKILDDERRTIGIVDFGVATSARAYQETVSIGGISVPGVDSAVLTVVCEISPTKPRASRRTP